MCFYFCGQTACPVVVVPRMCIASEREKCNSLAERQELNAKYIFTNSIKYDKEKTISWLNLVDSRNLSRELETP